jgi:molecular chaperone IbpA
MGNLQRYRSADLPQLMDRITKNSIGLDNFFDTFFDQDVTTNYPPYNLIHVNNVESRLEIALAGFKKKEVKVYTEYGKLFVTASKEAKEDKTDYVHQGLAQRSFERAWTLSDDVEVKNVDFADGLLTVTLGKIVPEHHSRKEYL